jgi:hypothetical protein
LGPPLQWGLFFRFLYQLKPAQEQTAAQLPVQEVPFVAFLFSVFLFISGKRPLSALGRGLNDRESKNGQA